MAHLVKAPFITSLFTTLCPRSSQNHLFRQTRCRSHAVGIHSRTIYTVRRRREEVQTNSHSSPQHAHSSLRSPSQVPSRNASSKPTTPKPSSKPKAPYRPSPPPAPSSAPSTRPDPSPASSSAPASTPSPTPQTPSEYAAGLKRMRAVISAVGVAAITIVAAVTGAYLKTEADAKAERDTLRPPPSAQSHTAKGMEEGVAEKMREKEREREAKREREVVETLEARRTRLLGLRDELRGKIAAVEARMATVLAQGERGGSSGA